MFLFAIMIAFQQTHERKPRESKLRIEFANAIEIINQELSEENHLKFLHWDLHKHYRRFLISILFLVQKFNINDLTLMYGSNSPKTLLFSAKVQMC